MSYITFLLVFQPNLCVFCSLFSRDFVEFFVGGRLERRLTGRGFVVEINDKRSLDGEPSYDDECGDDDDENHFYDHGKREYPEYFFDDRKRRPVVFIQGTGQEIRIVFRSDSSGTRMGFSAQFSVQQGGQCLFLASFSSFFCC